MNNRIKLQVWSEDQRRWRTAYVRVEMLHANISLLRGYSIKFRIQ